MCLFFCFFFNGISKQDGLKTKWGYKSSSTLHHESCRLAFFRQQVVAFWVAGKLTFPAFLQPALPNSPLLVFSFAMSVMLLSLWPRASLPDMLLLSQGAPSPCLQEHRSRQSAVV